MRHYAHRALIIAVLCLLATVFAPQTGWCGTRDGGGGGDPDAGQAVGFAKKTATWLNYHGARFRNLDVARFGHEVQLLAKSLEKGQVARIKFDPKKPRDGAGNPKPGVFRLQPYPHIVLWSQSWSKWMERGNFYKLYYQINLEVLGLAGVNERDRYDIARGIAEKWRDIEEVRVTQTSYSHDIGVPVEWRRHGIDDALKLEAKGRPGNSPHVWPPRTVVQSPLSVVVKAFNNLRLAESGSVGLGESREESTDMISVSGDSSGVYHVIFNARPGLDEKYHGALAFRRLREANGDHFGFRLKALDGQTTMIEMLPDSRLFKSLQRLRDEWVKSDNVGTSYGFFLEVPNENSMSFWLAIYDVDDDDDGIDLRISYSKTTAARYPYFEIDLSDGGIWVSYSTNCTKAYYQTYESHNEAAYCR